MKNILMVLFVLVLTQCKAQIYQAPDNSPLNVAYLPNNFAHDRGSEDKAILKIYYSQPQKKGREIFGDLVPFNKVWRIGANEAVEIKVYRDISFGGKQLSKGSYSMFAIPNKEEWTIIINSDLDYWGAYSYDETKDVLRISAPVVKLEKEVESFSIRCEDTSKNEGILRLAWDLTSAEVLVKY